MTTTPTSAEAPSTPLVVACVRYTDLRPDVDPLTGAITRDVHRAGLSAADEAAVEHALRIAEAWSAAVLVVTAGPAAADDMLRNTMALGCRALRIAWPPGDGGMTQPPGDGGMTQPPGDGGMSQAPGAGGSDRLGSAQGFVDDLGADERALARTVARVLLPDGPPALVICGDRSADRGTGAFPAFLAHELGAAQALGLVELRAEGDGVLVERRLDGGRRERLRVPQPAVCSVEGAGVRLRRASLPATLAAGRAAVPTISTRGSADDARVPMAVGQVAPYRPRTRVIPPPDSAAPRQRLLSLTGALVAHDPPTIIGPVDAREAADALLAFLDRHGYLGDGNEPAETQS
ncbi:MAG: electron transfer flavoprotein beta subunit [Acidimicrobiaceae bacterium]|nr:electron transfer flavoprotein beta subunit [Acidimicrobiaceae bacterium]